MGFPQPTHHRTETKAVCIRIFSLTASFKLRKKRSRKEEIERMAMAVQQGSRQQHDGVKVKFIETQFISSDAASFKAVVQRLTGKSSPSPAHSSPAPAPPQPQRPRPCRPAPFAGADAGQQQQQHSGWAAHEQQAAGHSHLFTMPTTPKQEQLRLEDQLYELCDFGDLLYATAAASRRDGFPY